MTPEQMTKEAAEAANIGMQMTLIRPKGARTSKGFPRGDLLCEQFDGSRAYSYDPYKVLAWLVVNGLAEVRGER